MKIEDFDPNARLIPNNLQNALDLLRVGKKAEAGNILTEIVRTEPNNEQAWLSLSACVALENQKRDCLKQVLRINPNNTVAIALLKELDTKNGIAAAPSLNIPQSTIAQSDQPLTANSLRRVISSDPLYRRNRLYALPPP